MSLDQKRSLLMEVIPDTVTIANLNRLVNGDMADIGEALINKEPVQNTKINHAKPETYGHGRSFYLLLSELETVTYQGITFTQPCDKELALRQTYYVADMTILFDKGCGKDVAKFEWEGSDYEHTLLEQGLVHLTQASAFQHCEAMRHCLVDSELIHPIEESLDESGDD